MRKIGFPLMVVALGVGHFATLFPETSYSQEFLTEQQLIDRLVGNTSTGFWEGYRYYEFLYPNGGLRGVSRGDRYSGDQE